MKHLHDTIWKEKSGFTVVESIVAMLLMALVSGILFSFYTLISKATTDWQRHLHLQNATHTISNQLAQDFLRAKRVEMPNEDSLELTLANRTIVYRRSLPQLFRNEMPMLESVVQLKQMNWTLEENIFGEKNTLQFELFLSNGFRSIAVAQTLHLRTPPRWKPMSSEP